MSVGTKEAVKGLMKAVGLTAIIMLGTIFIIGVGGGVYKIISTHLN